MDITNITAEEYRRSHCDRKEATHQCIGEVSIKPGLFQLNCSLCGEATTQLMDDMDVCNAVRTVCRVMGHKWESLTDCQRKQIIIEIAWLRKRSH